VNWTYIETIDLPATDPKVHETVCVNGGCGQVALAVLAVTNETDAPVGRVAVRTVCVAVAFAKMFLNLTTVRPVLFADRTLGTAATNKQFAWFGLSCCVHVLLLAALPPPAKASNAAAVAAAARPRMPRPRLRLRR
jgi:hypothetical protein